jgi:hypothetical protein
VTVVREEKDNEKILNTLKESLAEGTSINSSPFICPNQTISFRKALFVYECSAKNVEEQEGCKYFLLGPNDECSFLNRQGELQICTATEAFIG